MTQTYYRQCLLELDCGDSRTRQYSWIPEQFARVGKRLKLKTDDRWVNDWIVLEVYQNRLSEDQLPDAYRMVKGHRKNTGDSLPKQPLDFSFLSKMGTFT